MNEPRLPVPIFTMTIDNKPTAADLERRKRARTNDQRRREAAAERNERRLRSLDRGPSIDGPSGYAHTRTTVEE